MVKRKYLSALMSAVLIAQPCLVFASEEDEEVILSKEAGQEEAVQENAEEIIEDSEPEAELPAALEEEAVQEDQEPAQQETSRSTYEGNLHAIWYSTYPDIDLDNPSAYTGNVIVFDYLDLKNDSALLAKVKKAQSAIVTMIAFNPANLESYDTTVTYDALTTAGIITKFLTDNGLNETAIAIACPSNFYQGPSWYRDILDYVSSCMGKKPLAFGYDLTQKYAYDWSFIDGYEWKSLSTDFAFPAEKWETLRKSSHTPYTISAMYRLYNPNSGEHFYTQNEYEANTLAGLGWHHEGISWLTTTAASVPVYRLYNANAGDHHYTTSLNEKDTLVKVGWKYEGIGWQAEAKGSVDNVQEVWRLYNPNATAGSHHYTADKNEYNVLATLGWKQEGSAWYCVPQKTSEKSGSYFKEIDGKTYAYSSSGRQITGVAEINGKLYCFDSSDNGAMVKDGIHTATIYGSVRTVYANADGSLKTGPITISGNDYYFSKSSGYRVEGDLVYRTDLGSDLQGWYYYKSDGTMAKADTTYEGYSKCSKGSQLKIGSNGLVNVKANDLEIGLSGISDEKVTYMTDSNSGAKIKMGDYFKKHYGSTRSNQLLDAVLPYEGYPYKYGGRTPETSFDCSGLVSYAINKAWDSSFNIYAYSAQTMYDSKMKHIAKSELQPGDFIFYENNKEIYHVAIYVGGGYVYHSGDGGVEFLRFASSGTKFGRYS